MRQAAVVVITGALTLAASADRAAGSILQEGTAQGLVGTWQLVSRIDRTAAGEVVAEPELGSDPVALLVYDRSGHVAAQLMRRDRSRASATADRAAPAPGASNNSGAIGGYNAYFGTYEIDSVQGIVTHSLEAALVPGDVGKRISRHFRIAGDELEMWFSTTAADGRPVTRTLKWKRVGQATNDHCRR